MLKDYLKQYKGFKKEIKLFLLALLFFGLGGAYFSLVFNLFLKETGLGEKIIGSILSYRAFGNVIFAIPAAALVHKLPSKIAFCSSFIISFILQIIMILFPKPELLAGLSFIIGFSEMIFVVATPPYLMENSELEERPYIFSLVAGAHMFCNAIGSISGGYLPQILPQAISLATRYQWTMLIGLFTGLLGIPFLLKLPYKNIETGGSFLNLWINVRYGLILKLLMPRALIGLGAGLFIPFINLYFKSVHQFSSNNIGILFTFAQFSTLLAILTTPKLVKKFGLVGTVVITELLSLPFMYILGASKSILLVIPSYLIRQALMNMSGPANQNFTMEITTTYERPVINSLSSMTDSVARAISMRMGGSIIETSGYSRVFFYAIGFYALSISIFYSLFKKFGKKI